MKQLFITLLCLGFSIAGIAADRALAVQVGEQAPSLTFTDVHVDGGKKTFNLSDLKGKVVVLEYWGPFCGPCIKAFPHINQLVETFKNEDVRFISIADQGYAGCKKVLARHPLKTWQVFDVALFTPFWVNAMPRTIIIGKDGTVAAYTTPKKLTEKVLRRVLKGEKTASHYNKSDFKP